MLRRVRSHRYLWAALLLTFGVIGMVAWGSDRVAAPAAEGTTLAGQLSTDTATRGILRIATFNIHGGQGTDHHRDLDRVADVLVDFDFIAAQEVRGSTFMGAPDQAAILAEKLNVAWLFAPAERRWWRDSFGNALLTRLPISRWRRTPLPCTQGKAYRNVVVVDLIVDGSTVHVLLTHVDRRADRKSQLQEVIRMYQQLPPPAILLGDLNTDRHDPNWAALLAEDDTVDVLANAGNAADNDRRIDWIVARGMEVVSTGVRDRGASDHPCYWAELRLPADRVAGPRQSTNVPR